MSAKPQLEELAHITAELYQTAAAFGVPGHLREGLVNYAVHHRPVGGFLTACLANDFCTAVCRADHDSFEGLRAIAKFIHNELPSECHGSYAAVEKWLEPQE
jgi:hypothetical protein